MGIPVWRLTVRAEFCASHALRHYQGKCESMHGHNFHVEVMVEGDKLTEDTELLVDFKTLKRDLNQVLDTLDHKDLNSTPQFSVKNPSSENIAQYIYKSMKPMVEACGVRMHSVSVSEKSAQSACYMEL